MADVSFIHKYYIVISVHSTDAVQTMNEIEERKRRKKRKPRFFFLRRRTSIQEGCCCQGTCVWMAIELPSEKRKIRERMSQTHNTFLFFSPTHDARCVICWTLYNADIPAAATAHPTSFSSTAAEAGEEAFFILFCFLYSFLVYIYRKEMRHRRCLRIQKQSRGLPVFGFGFKINFVCLLKKRK